MNLSNELVSQFVKATKDDTKTDKQTIVYGTTKVEYGGKTYVKLDGSDLLTPVSTTTDVKDGERVTVMIKDHTATITGNMSSPSARTNDVQELGGKINQVETLVADKVSAKELEAESARIDTLVSDNVTIKEKLTANEAEIDKLVAADVTITGTLTAQEASIKKLDTEKLSADAADIKFATIESLDAVEINVHSLEATYGEFKDLTTKDLTAINASIKKLDVEKLNAEQADLKYVNIDFANVDNAWFDTFYATSGMIKDLTLESGVVVKELVGVTIKGDLIQAGTIQADKIVVKGDDGLYYKLNIEAGAAAGEGITEEDLQNRLHGTAIIAKTITAEKISVDDLVAFGATIGGFHITNSALYSGVKASVDNTTTGVYMDSEGQFALGDSNEYLKFFKDTDGQYKLDISAGTIKLSTSSKTLNETMDELTSTVGVLSSTSDGLLSSVTKITTDLEKSNEALGDSISKLTEQVSAKVSAEDVKITVQSELLNGVNKVVTETGYVFDDTGMTVQKSGSEMKTQITENGMTVYQNSEAVLTANNSGVDAKNLHATTYLIVGKNSRFEDYGTNRTGCFWIGG